MPIKDFKTCTLYNYEVHIKTTLSKVVFCVICKYTSYDDILGIRALKDKAYERHAHVFYILSNGIRFCNEVGQQ